MEQEEEDEVRGFYWLDGWSEPRGRTPAVFSTHESNSKDPCHNVVVCRYSGGGEWCRPLASTTKCEGGGCLIATDHILPSTCYFAISAILYRTIEIL